MPEEHKCIELTNREKFSKSAFRINNGILIILVLVSLGLIGFFYEQLLNNLYLLAIVFLIGLLSALVYAYQKGRDEGFWFGHRFGYDAGKLKAMCTDKDFDSFLFEFEFKHLVDDKQPEATSSEIPATKAEIEDQKGGKASHATNGVGGIDLGISEMTYRLNAYTTFEDAINFTQVAWNLTGTFLRSIKDIGALTPKQKVCVFMIGKSKRLLRSIYKLIIDGYYPEALILNRTLFETQVLLTYVLEEKGQKRAQKWLSRKKPTERWPISELMKDNKSLFEDFYSGASMYAHNHALSSGHYINIKKNSFSIVDGPFGGGLERFQYAGNVLGHSAMIVGALCEMSRHQFNDMQEYDDAYKKLTELPYYKESVTEAVKTIELDEKLKEKVIDLLAKLEGK